MSQETIDQLLAGVTALTWQSVVMFAVAGLLLYLAIVKDYEPLLLLPDRRRLPPGQPAAVPGDRSGRAAHVLYDAGIENELFPLLIFIGIGAMTDFGPLLENPRMILLGAAGQFGIFARHAARPRSSGSPGPRRPRSAIIGAIDGPTSIYVSRDPGAAPARVRSPSPRTATWRSCR